MNIFSSWGVEELDADSEVLAPVEEELVLGWWRQRAPVGVVVGVDEEADSKLFRLGRGLFCFYFKK